MFIYAINYDLMVDRPYCKLHKSGMACLCADYDTAVKKSADIAIDKLMDDADEVACVDDLNWYGSEWTYNRHYVDGNVSIISTITKMRVE